MREIIFRGQRVDTKEWMYGYLVVVDKYYYILTGKLKFANGSIMFEKYNVIPETVGQYTGAKDDNGKRIFEGDILKDDLDRVYKAIYHVASCSFMVECIVSPREYEKGRYRIGEEWTKTLEVIGNIHDTELLGGL